MAVLCLLFMTAPLEGKVKKRKPRRRARVVRVVTPPKPIKEEVLDAFNDSLSTDSILADS